MFCPWHSLALSFITVGCFILVFSWFDILKDISRYFPKLWGSQEKAIEITLQVTLPISTLTTLVLILFDQILLCWISGGFGLMIFFGCFSFLMHGFTKNMFLLCKDSKNMGKVMSTTLRIKKILFCLAMCLVGASVFFALATVFNVKCTDYLGSNYLNKEALFFELAYACYLIQSVICFNEVKQHVKK